MFFRVCIKFQPVVGVAPDYQLTSIPVARVRQLYIDATPDGEGIAKGWVAIWLDGQPARLAVRAASLEDVETYVACPHQSFVLEGYWMEPGAVLSDGEPHGR